MASRGPLPAVKSGTKATGEAKTLARPNDLPEAAVEVWDLLAKQLAIAGRLQPEDGVKLELLCRSVARCRAIQLELETGKLIVELANKTLTISQAYKALEIELAIIERGSRDFGLSPAARGSMKAKNPDQEEKDFDDFLARRPGSDAKA